MTIIEEYSSLMSPINCQITFLHRLWFFQDEGGGEDQLKVSNQNIGPLQTIKYEIFELFWVLNSRVLFVKSNVVETFTCKDPLHFVKHLFF